MSNPQLVPVIAQSAVSACASGSSRDVEFGRGQSSVGAGPVTVGFDRSKMSDPDVTVQNPAETLLETQKDPIGTSSGPPLDPLFAEGKFRNLLFCKRLSILEGERSPFLHFQNSVPGHAGRSGRGVGQGRWRCSGPARASALHSFNRWITIVPMSTRLIELVERLAESTIVLVGDFMLDRYLFGRTERISPEAPIPVLRFTREEHRLGGAGFVLAGLATLGAKVRAVGVVGDDACGEKVRAHVAALGADASGLVRVPGRPTVEKTRLLGSSEDRSHQQMLRLDVEESRPLDEPSSREIVSRAEKFLDGCSVLCLEDYDKGALPASVCQRLIEIARARNVPVLIDPARLNDYAKYAGATAIKLNRPEAERATGLPARTSEECERAAGRLLTSLDVEAVLITLNDRGCFLATRDGARQLLPSRPRQVADATGAGDMVLATLCLARAAGADWHDAAALANVAAGLEVEKLGCVPITRQEIIHDLMTEGTEHAGKERSLTHLLLELARHRAQGRKIVFTNGCFDLIHLGHVKYFQWARRQGDVLVVGVNTDQGISRLKGPNRPIVGEADRIGVLEELQSIDYLIRFDEDTPLELIRAIKPEVLVKGADYKKQDVVGWDFVEGHGGRVGLAPLIDGKSTSSVIRRILETHER